MLDAKPPEGVRYPSLRLQRQTLGGVQRSEDHVSLSSDEIRTATFLMIMRLCNMLYGEGGRETISPVVGGGGGRGKEEGAESR